MKLEIYQRGALIQDLIVIDVKGGKRVPVLVKGKAESAVFGTHVEALECTQVCQ